MKKLVKILIALILIVVIVAGVGLLAIDSLARTGIEKGATYALQVPTTVEGVNVSLMGGTLKIEGLQIANPEGYQAANTPFLAKMSLLGLGIDSGTVLSDPVVVKKFEIDGVDLHLIQKGLGFNVNEVLNNLKRFESETKDTQESPGKKIQVDVITVKNVTAYFHLPAALSAKPVKVTLPEIVLNDVSSEDSGGVLVSELAAKILPKIIEAVLDKARDNDILGNVVGGIDKTLKGLSDAAGEEVKKGFEDVKDKLGGGMKDALDVLRPKQD